VNLLKNNTLDEVYTFHHDGKFGYGISIEGVGLVTITEAIFATDQEAQAKVTRVYALLTNDKVIEALCDALPKEFDRVRDAQAKGPYHRINNRLYYWTPEGLRAASR